MTDNRENEWQDKLQYVARPLEGVWATPPFLHNGSVPNLDQLLSPVKARWICFYIGNFLFDQDKVGYVTKQCEDPIPTKDSPDEAFYDKNGFKFVTSKQADPNRIPGNSNEGHEFKDVPNCKQLEVEHRGENGVVGCLLAPEHRKAIIEYLKTL